MVLDHIHGNHLDMGLQPKRANNGVDNVLASLGARLFSPKHLSTQVGWTIRKGYDFPAETLRRLNTWGMTLSIIQEDGCPSTRGQLEYIDSTFASNGSTLPRLESRVLRI